MKQLTPEQEIEMLKFQIKITLKEVQVISKIVQELISNQQKIAGSMELVGKMLNIKPVEGVEKPSYFG